MISTLLLVLLVICFLISIHENLPFLKVFLFGLLIWVIDLGY
ncbi:hypothetical protein STRIC_1824 [Streptococcus ictaluri 707-05]|uniref:Uncharacterized protein n=1 Tax=Streptococcus ictaluri 707-05 TaxID=764299 RepID=G5K4T7_9STRE|nr:hypothetical protein STRIC_1824 [Streptococcus ictaluri 707-05]